MHLASHLWLFYSSLSASQTSDQPAPLREWFRHRPRFVGGFWTRAELAVLMVRSLCKLVRQPGQATSVPCWAKLYGHFLMLCDKKGLSKPGQQFSALETAPAAPVLYFYCDRSPISRGWSSLQSFHSQTCSLLCNGVLQNLLGGASPSPVLRATGRQWL